MESGLEACNFTWIPVHAELYHLSQKWCFKITFSKKRFKLTCRTTANWLKIIVCILHKVRLNRDILNIKFRLQNVVMNSTVQQPAVTLSATCRFFADGHPFPTPWPSTLQYPQPPTLHFSPLDLSVTQTSVSGVVMSSQCCIQPLYCWSRPS